MVDFEQNIIATLPNDISLWKRYVDDTICFEKSNSINHVIESLNGFHNNIKFTIQKEEDILLTCKKIYLTLLCIARKRILIYTSTVNLFLQTIGNVEHLKP